MHKLGITKSTRTVQMCIVTNFAWKFCDIQKLKSTKKGILFGTFFQK